MSDMKQSRNDEIVELVRVHKWTIMKVADKYGITRQRVSQILQDRGIYLMQEKSWARQMRELKKLSTPKQHIYTVRVQVMCTISEKARKLAGRVKTRRHCICDKSTMKRKD